MSIKRDLSELPRRGSTGIGTPPVAEPQYVTALAEAWHQALEDQGRATAFPDDRWRVSDAGICARAASYDIRRRDAEHAAHQVDAADNEAVVRALTKVAELRPTNPPSVADSWRFNLGTMIHEHLQAAVQRAFPGAGVEVVVDLRPDGIPGSGHADIVIDTPDPEQPRGFFRVVIEVKTINGFGFKKAATTFRNVPEGPRSSAFLQGCVLAAELDADLLVIGYLALELLSPSVAEHNDVDELGRFTAEWWYGPDQFKPPARAELNRVARILDYVDGGHVVPRQIPDLGPGARVTNPATGLYVVEEDGAVVDTGNTWHCDYCRWQGRCLEDGE